MRTVKILGLVFAGIVTLFILLLAGVWLFINPNDYKQAVVDRVKLSTGRELRLDGDLKLSIFPWAALELGTASLSNPPGFDQEPLVAVKHAKMRVRLWPLLHHQLEVGKIEIDGLDLRLKKDAAGHGNWEFGNGSAGEAPASDARTEALQSLEGVRIKDSRISTAEWVMSNVDLDVGTVSGQQSIPVTFRFEALRGADQTALSASGKLQAQLDFSKQRYAISDGSFAGDLKPGGAPQAMPWKLELPAALFDAGAKSLDVGSFTASAASAKISGSIAGSTSAEAPELRGRIRAEPFSVREWLVNAGKPVPNTKDPKALASFSADTAFTYKDKTLSLSNLDVRLDSSKLTGSASVATDPTAMQFALVVDQIDVDRYLGPEPAPSTPAKPMDLSADALKSLRVNGSLAVGRAVISGVTLSNVEVSIDSKDGLLKVSPLKASLYGGQLAAAVVYDVRGTVPLLQIDQTMKGIQIADVTKAVLKSNRLTGRGNCSARLAGQGRNSDLLIKSLKGHVDADLADGAVEGIDLWYEIKRAESLIRTQTLPSDHGSGRTRFDTFRTAMDLDKGVAVTRDLTIASQQLKVTGTGTTDLATKNIDFKLLAKLLKSPTEGAQTTASLIDIPLQITGSMNAPKVRVDLQNMAKARVKQEIEAHKDELQKKLQDKLKDKLNNLFH